MLGLKLIQFFSNITAYFSVSRFKALVNKEISQLFRNKAFLFFITLHAVSLPTQILASE